MVYKNVNGYTFQHIHELVKKRMGNADYDDNIDILNIMQEFGTYDGIWVFAGIRLKSGYTRAYEKYINGGYIDDSVKEKMVHLVEMARERYEDVFMIESVDKGEFVKKGFNLFVNIFSYLRPPGSIRDCL